MTSILGEPFSPELGAALKSKKGTRRSRESLSLTSRYRRRCGHRTPARQLIRDVTYACLHVETHSLGAVHVGPVRVPLRVTLEVATRIVGIQLEVVLVAACNRSKGRAAYCKVFVHTVWQYVYELHRGDCKGKGAGVMRAIDKTFERFAAFDLTLK